MRERGWIRQMSEISKGQWEMSLQANENLIRDNLIQIEMAKHVIKLCKKKISEFPEDKAPQNSNQTSKD